MSQWSKKKYLVETTGVIGKEIYSATDPDDAARTARRAEIFYNLVYQHPRMSGEEAIALATEYIDNESVLPKFQIKKVVELKR
jgi:hypothetical protein